MKSINAKSIFIFICFLLFSFVADAQALDDAAQANKVWRAVILYSGLFVGIITIVGIIVVYNAKSSKQPDEFKKFMMNWIYGVLFLWVGFGLLSTIIGIVRNSANTVTF